MIDRCVGDVKSSAGNCCPRSISASSVVSIVGARFYSMVDDVSVANIVSFREID